MPEQEEAEITIEDLELSLEVYEIESDQKLSQLQQLFQEKGALDLSKMFYEERSTIKIKFQNIITDLIQFLVKQEVATTEKLRKTFYRILENPLHLLFKISRFEIFDLRLNGFDIELEPIEAIVQLGKSLDHNIGDYLQLADKKFERYDGKQYKSWDSYMQQALLSMIQDKIFIFYSYLRKGAGILKRKFENKVKIVELFNSIQHRLLPVTLLNEDKKTLKQLSVLNYEIYELEDSFDVLNLYIKIPFRSVYKESFHEFELLATKAHQASNYSMYILVFAKYGKQILEKIRQEGIDPLYDDYIQNALKSLLEMWGCRICYYQEFCDLFTALFMSHSDEVKVLKVCLEHTPDMQREDVVLLRKNFQLQLSKKHHELLSLMKARSLEEINGFLNGFYHRTFYNINFKDISRETIISLLTLVNGNSSIQQFFNTTEKAFKEWNHTIDFAHAHKFIDSEFAYPQLSTDKVRETLNLLTNLCILESKGFDKEYENLIRASNIGKALLALMNFISSHDKDWDQQFCNSKQLKNLIVESSFFLKQCLNPANDAESFIKTYSGLIGRIQDPNRRKQFQKNIIEYVKDNIEQFHIQSCMNSMSLCSMTESADIVQIFLSGLHQNNELVKKFRFLDMPADSTELMNVSQADLEFINKNLVVQDGRITAKDLGIFKLSELEIMTNPIQLQKVMDNYYFTLDSNAKRFIEYITLQWHNIQLDIPRRQFYTSTIKKIVELYPICTALLSSTRIQMAQQKHSVRFCQLLASSVGVTQQSEDILKVIIDCSSVRYRNGKDYVQEEVVPMILKELFKQVNTGKQQIASKALIMAAKVLGRANIREFRIDTLQKSIEKNRFMLKNCDNAELAQKLSQSHKNLMSSFLRKKEMDMRKEGLVACYEKIIWDSARNYTPSNESTCEPTDQPIPEQIIVTPYTISQDFNAKQFKIKKSSQVTARPQPEQSKTIQEIALKLQRVEGNALDKLMSNRGLPTAPKIINLTESRYNISNYLGRENIELLAQRENLHLQIARKGGRTINVIPDSKKKDDTSFVHYYLKECEIPAISHKIILEDVSRLLKSQNPTVSYLWINQKNIQHYFMDLFSVFQFAAQAPSARQPEKQASIEQIVDIVSSDSIKAMKKILEIFSKLGYSSIWAESLNMFWLNFPIRKFLGLNQPSEESILAIVLRVCLQNDNLRDNIDHFLGKLFQTRGSQTALMYKVTMDKALMNLIMKSLSINHLNKISLLFHSNFNNLRLYTDQLHEGLKALNMASANRSYNQFIKLSKSVEDQQFENPMKLFKENFSFFCRIEKQGYVFKKNQERKLTTDRLTNIFRSADEKQSIHQKVDQAVLEYTKEIEQLQLTIANRVKSFYLVTKLRDLSYQNSLMISIIHSVMKSENKTCAQILQQINKVEIFSLMNELYNELIVFEDDWRDMDKYSGDLSIDDNVLNNQLTICTTRRFSHSMNKIYEQCDLEFDEVIQRCFDALKVFFRTEEGIKWIQNTEIYPAFLIKSFINQDNAHKYLQTIGKKLRQNKSESTFSAAEGSLIEDLLKGFRNSPRSSFVCKAIQISYNGKKYTPISIFPEVVQKLITNETLVPVKSSGNILFNKYKTSEATLQEIEVLGYIISYSLLNKEALKFNLHPSIVAALSFNISQMDFLLDVDFKIWEELKSILSCSDSSTLQLNFSYNFESLETFKPIRIELVNKGSSKKVNNLNRGEFCDLVCCYILYDNLRSQIGRLLKTILSVVPKELIACSSTKSILSLFYNSDKTQKLLDQYMRKIGVVLPETLIDEQGKRHENLKDFQNVQWLQQLILQSPSLRAKYWKDETNLFIVTVIGPKGSIKRVKEQFLIEHFGSKQEMKAQLDKM